MIIGTYSTNNNCSSNLQSSIRKQSSDKLSILQSQTKYKQCGAVKGHVAACAGLLHAALKQLFTRQLWRLCTTTNWRQNHCWLIPHCSIEPLWQTLTLTASEWWHGSSSHNGWIDGMQRLASCWSRRNTWQTCNMTHSYMHYGTVQSHRWPEATLPCVERYKQYPLIVAIPYNFYEKPLTSFTWHDHGHITCF